MLFNTRELQIMKAEILVSLPENNPKITLKKLKSGTYVYFEYERIYNSKTRHTTPKRKCIGKLSATDLNMMIPNAIYPEYFGVEHLSKDASFERSCSLSVGAFIVIEKIIQDYQISYYLKEALRDDKNAGVFMDFVAYEIICASNVAQHYPDYAYKHPLFTPEMKIYSDSYISNMFDNLTADHRQRFLDQWNQDRNKRKKIYVSYDSTNRHSTAGEIQMVEFGKPKDGKRDVPIINQGIAYDCTFREPLFYESYPGSIVDVSMITHMVEKAASYGYSNIGFILDRGYFAKENLFFMDEHNYSFIIMAKGRINFVRTLIEEAMGTFELERNFLIKKFQVQGTTIKKKIFPQDERDRDRFVHVYYNELIAAVERRKLEEKISKWEKELSKSIDRKVCQGNLDCYTKFFNLEYNEQRELVSFVADNSAIEEEKFWYGYFCIITSNDISAEEALKLYKGRDASEKLFMMDKSFLGNNCYRVESQSSKDAKEWVGFVAEIIRNKIYTNLIDSQEQNQVKTNEMSVPEVIGELEKIEICKQLKGGYHMNYPLTKKQKAILSCFNISPENAVARIVNLCHEIPTSNM